MITQRIVHFVMLFYFIALIDRVNIGFAALTMNKDLGFSPTVFNFGAGIFFLGCFLFEVPSNLVLDEVGARFFRRWIADPVRRAHLRPRTIAANVRENGHRRASPTIIPSHLTENSDA